ncbi:helix-turn-helix domain-containing protein [Alicyclobacillus dauci]|uniref:Helix-turn-helix domain-containing protein n=1 Tax=Alicyclobacillus dauci TaxID=1475485 RepID=A0ABY6Z1V7_9BACL|nr:helix-turn-helix domain-containing protein [Alicyclobacillus dauci]WAH36284.1 helix-turn-helix domain-containing protein [Alicyclobacillus dauci]
MVFKEESEMSPRRRGRDRLNHNLKNVVDDIARTKTQEETITVLLQTICNTFHSDVSLVYLVDEDQGVMKPNVLAQRQSETSLSSLDLSQCSQNILTGPFRWPTDTSEPLDTACAFYREMQQAGFSTWFSLPLRVGPTVIGVIAVGYFRYEYLVSDVREMLWNFANDVAQSLIRFLPVKRQLKAPLHGTENPALANLYEQERRMQRLLSNHRQLTNSLFESESLTTLTQTLSQMIGHPVAVLDRFFGTLSTFPVNANWGFLLTRLRQWMAQTKLNMNNHPFPVRSSNLAGSSFVVAPIQMGDVPLGYFIVKEDESKLDDLDVIATQQATMVLAIHFYKRGLHIEKRGNGFQELLNQLLDQPGSWSQSDSDQAAMLGWDVRAEQSLLVGQFQFGEQESLPHRNLNTIVEYVRTRLAVDFPQILIARRQDTLVLVLPHSLTNRNELSGLIHWIRSIQCEFNLPAERSSSMTVPSGPHRVTFGISHPVQSPELFNQAYQEALMAARLATLVAPDKDFASAADIRLHLLLSPLAKLTAVQEFISDKLAKLITYDEEHQTEMFKTLKVYLEQNGNLSDTSAALFIHRTSLQYRLKRIESIILSPLESSQVRFELHLSIFIHEILTANHGLDAT